LRSARLAFHPTQALIQRFLRFRRYFAVIFGHIATKNRLLSIKSIQIRERSLFFLSISFETILKYDNTDLNR